MPPTPTYSIHLPMHLSNFGSTHACYISRTTHRDPTPVCVHNQPLELGPEITFLLFSFMDVFTSGFGNPLIFRFQSVNRNRLLAEDD